MNQVMQGLHMTTVDAPTCSRHQIRYHACALLRTVAYIITLTARPRNVTKARFLLLWVIAEAFHKLDEGGDDTQDRGQWFRIPLLTNAFAVVRFFNATISIFTNFEVATYLFDNGKELIYAYMYILLFKQENGVSKDRKYLDVKDIWWWKQITVNVF